MDHSRTQLTAPHALCHNLSCCRVSNRLQQYAPGGKPGAAGMQSARTSTHNNRRSSSTSPSRFDRLSASAAAVPLAPDFYRRQDALLQRRAQLAAKRRASDEDDLNECTCEPHACSLFAWAGKKASSCCCWLLQCGVCCKHTDAPGVLVTQLQSGRTSTPPAATCSAR